MHTTITRLALTAAAATFTLTGCADASAPPPFMERGHLAGTTSTGPVAPGTPAAGPHNEADSMFAMMMIPHHAQAIQMSDLVLGKTGIDPRVSALARQIKDAQAPEIAQMRGWLVGWGQPVPASDGSMPTMEHGGMDHGTMPGMGMLSRTEMAELADATGAGAQRLFLTGMIEHHEGAIDMAQDVLDDGTNPDVQALARSVITSQRAEITTMRQLLGN